MQFLLDGLHEDLNRVKKKPYVEQVDSDGRPDAVVACESWSKHLLRNDSHILDICFGQLRSHVTCAHCQHESVTFDAFGCLPLPIPLRVTKPLVVALQTLPLHAFQPALPPCLVTVQVALTDTLKQLTQQLLPHLHAIYRTIAPLTKPLHALLQAMESTTKDRLAKPETTMDESDDSLTAKLLVFRLGSRTKIQKWMDREETMTCSELLSLHSSYGYYRSEQVPSALVTHGYAVGGVSQHMVVAAPVFPTGSAVSSRVSGSLTPLYFTQTNVTPFAWLLPRYVTGKQLYGFVFLHMVSYHMPAYQSMETTAGEPMIPFELWLSMGSFYEGTKRIEYSDEEVVDLEELQIPAYAASIMSSYVCLAICYTPHSAWLPTHTRPQALTDLVRFSSMTSFMHRFHPASEGVAGSLVLQWPLPDETVEDVMTDRDSEDTDRPSTPRVSIYQCLNTFCEREQLKEQETFYCSKCKQHLAPVKKMDIYTSPDILIVQLKRFSYAPGVYFIHREKINALVEFPIEGLDLTPYVLHRTKPRDENQEKNMYLYDLYAVSEHGGGLGGGHYTAVCKHPVSGKWYSYNDSHVSEIPKDKLHEHIVTSQAYVLFYKRR